MEDKGKAHCRSGCGEPQRGSAESGFLEVRECLPRASQRQVIICNQMNTLGTKLIRTAAILVLAAFAATAVAQSTPPASNTPDSTPPAASPAPGADAFSAATAIAGDSTARRQ